MRARPPDPVLRVAAQPLDDPAGAFHDGEPFLDAAGVHASIELEWDVVLTADLKRAGEAIAVAGNDQGAKDNPKDQTTLLRQQLQAGAKDVLKAVTELAILSGKGGADVFGSFDAVEQVKSQLQDARDELSSMGPKQPVIIDENDEDGS